MCLVSFLQFSWPFSARTKVLIPMTAKWQLKKNLVQRTWINFPTDAGVFSFFGFQSTEQTSGRFLLQEWKAAGFWGVWRYTWDVAMFAGSAKYWWESMHKQPQQQSENGSMMTTSIPKCILVVLALQLLLNTILWLSTYPSSDSLSQFSSSWRRKKEKNPGLQRLVLFFCR